MAAIDRQSVDGIPYSQDGLGPNYNDFVTMWQWSTAVTDVAVSCCLAVTLNSRIQGFSSRTDGLLKRLVLTAIRTAAYTAVLAVAGGASPHSDPVRSARNASDVASPRNSCHVCRRSSPLAPCDTHSSSFLV